MTVSEYTQLKEQIIFAISSHSRHGEILNSLKELFKENINSVRRLEQIKSIGELLNVLELRDVLSEDDVSPLRDIARKLPNNADLMHRIMEYEEVNIPRKSGNYYLTKHEIPPRSEPHIESVININPISNVMSKRKKQRVFETISEEIGSFWKDLARNLEIREREIDDIHFQNTTMTMKATKLLERFEYKADPQRWFFVLCDALEKSRRRDLVTSLQEIMAMNI